jgi:predicted DNA-binding transcriptional regulator YafY
MNKQFDHQKDSCLRKFLMLMHLPRAPANGKLPSELAELLKDAGQHADLRTIQRDLKKLALSFDLRSEREGTSNRWSWDEQAISASFPAMTKSEALALVLAELYIFELLPPELSSQLEARFQQAKKTLSSESSLKNWTDVVQILPRRPRSTTPQPSEKVLMDCFQALQKNRKIELVLKDIRQPIIFSAEGILLDSGEIYLVGTFNDNELDVRSFSFNQISQSTVLKTKAKRIKGFRLHDYAEAFLNTSKASAWRLEEFLMSELPIMALESTNLLKLELKTRGRLTNHLLRHKFSEDQEVIKIDDEWSMVTISTVNSLALRTWILSWGQEVQVLGPKRFREEICIILTGILERYHSPS